MIVKRLIDKGLIAKHAVPKHFPDSIQYLTTMGSTAYGVATDKSDLDIYGFCIPPKHIIFPHLHGYIAGFGQQPEKFEQWQMHHVKDEERKTEYDLTIFNIVKYFSLVMENNPNMIDSLFTGQNAILHCSAIAQMVRDNRKLFLHKGSWHKFKGYAFQQMHRMRSREEREVEAQVYIDKNEKVPEHLQIPQGKRKQLFEEFGYDVKFAYHVVRLIDEAEQILSEGDLDLTRNAEKLKAIRRGEWKIEDVRGYFTEKEKALETAYANSKLPHGPDEGKIRRLLMDCLEHHYGNLAECVVDVDKATQTLKDVAELIRNAGY
jgi:predicted nucleotidyltransferase